MATKSEIEFGHSLSDMMASIAVVFLLIAASAITMIHRATMASVDQKKAEISQKKNDLFLAIAQDLGMKPGSANTRVGDDCITIDNHELYRLKISFLACPTGLGFQSKSYTLSPTQIEYARSKVLGVFAKVCRLYAAETANHLMNNVSLIGHTDSQPLSADRNREFSGCNFGSTNDTPGARRLRDGFCNNVQLSARRAQTVFFLVRTEMQAERDEETHQLVANCMDKIFTVSGNGPTRPIAGDPWQSELVSNSANDQNRRVELTIDFAQPTL